MSKSFSTAPTAALDALDAQGCGLRVEFVRIGDQFAHRIFALDQNIDSTLLLESVEVATKFPWPKSPALQGLNIDDLQRHDPESGLSSPSAMLIGMAGDGHWSLSIEPRQEHRRVSLAFDVACRVKSIPASLTSTYITTDSIKIERDGSSLKLETRVGDFSLMPLPLSNREEQVSCRLSNEDNSIVFTREIQWTDSAPTTLRWRYEIARLG